MRKQSRLNRATSQEQLVNSMVNAQPVLTPKQQQLATIWKSILGVAITLLVFCILFGGYHISKFIIVWLADLMNAESWVNTSSVIAWVCSALLVLCIFGALRAITSTVSSLFKFVFKFAQSDIVTIILASGVNLLFMVFGGWLTFQTVTLIDKSGVGSFFDFGNPLSVFVLFYMFAGALIWIPRLGAYGENQIGAVLDNNDR